MSCEITISLVEWTLATEVKMTSQQTGEYWSNFSLYWSWRIFLARMTAYETALRSCISALELDLPDAGIKGVHEPGQEYEFYGDVTSCLKWAQKEIYVSHQRSS